jgi:hypothetical protein
VSQAYKVTLRATIDGETGELVGTLLAESAEKAKQGPLREWEPSEKRRNNITKVLAEPIVSDALHWSNHNE